MRIISGSLGGQTFESPRSHKTHPMSEKMRGALFNSLGDISGLTVFDAYGGSGAIGPEAYSRGASKVLITEIDYLATKIISDNIKKLGVEENVTLVRANAASYSVKNPLKKFSIVICDPPYDDIVHNQILQLGSSVEKEGLLVLSLPPEYKSYVLDGFDLIHQKKYGDATLVFQRKI